MSLPKMHWLPKDQWQTPRDVTGVDELNGKAPLAGLFSGGVLAAEVFHASQRLPSWLQSTFNLPPYCPLDSMNASSRLLARPQLVARRSWHRASRMLSANS